MTFHNSLEQLGKKEIKKKIKREGKIRNHLEKLTSLHGIRILPEGKLLLIWEISLVV